MIEERRFKYFLIDRELAICLLRAGLGNGDDEYVSLPRIEGPPEGAEVVNVVWLWDRLAFGILVWHPSFPIVPDSQMIEVVDAVPLEVRRETFAVKDFRS